MQFLSLCVLITLSANSILHGAASWIEQVKKAPSRDTVQFLTAQHAIHHDNSTLFMNMLYQNSSLVHYVHKQSTAITQYVDLLKAAIGTLREDRFFFVTQLLQHGATINSMHIASCIAALRMRPEQFNYPIQYFCIEHSVLTNLQKLFCTLDGHLVADTQIPAQKALQRAVRDFICTDGSAVANIPDLLAAVEVYPVASSSGR
jgi:hypothetical protein